MTIGPVDLTEIQQTLSAMEDPSTPPPTAPAAGSAAAGSDGAFATSLAEAAEDLSVGAALSSTSSGNSLTGLSGSADQSGLLDSIDTGGDAEGIEDAMDLAALLLVDLGGGLGAPEGRAVAGSSASTALEGTVGGAGVTGQDVVQEAESLEGTPYVWGGTTPAGFDCSGFTQYVYAQLGIALPRTSEEQATVGSPVSSLADAQPGDLVFFAGSDGTASSPGHVGIYVGNGEMIDAPYTGTTVQVQPVSSAGPVVAIRQVLPEEAGGDDASSLTVAEEPNASSSGSSVIGNVTVPDAYASTVEQAAASNGIPASLLAALLNQESGFNPSAVSSAGAEGIAQFMPSTAAGMGIDPFDPTEAIDGAAQLLGSYAQQFGSFADALAAYNAGPGAVEEYGGIPPYAQTEAYVSDVLAQAGLSRSAGS